MGEFGKREEERDREMQWGGERELERRGEREGWERERERGEEREERERRGEGEGRERERERVGEREEGEAAHPPQKRHPHRHHHHHELAHKTEQVQNRIHRWFHMTTDRTEPAYPIPIPIRAQAHAQRTLPLSSIAHIYTHHMCVS